MTFKRLLIFPIVWVILFIAAEIWLLDSVFFTTFLRVEISIVKLLAFLGAWAAAMSFEEDAYLRRAWGLIGACMFFLLVRDAVVALNVTNVRLISAVLVTTGNVVQVIGTWLLARSSSVAELPLPGTKGKRIAVLIAIALFALAVAGPPVAQSAKAVFHGDISEVTSLASGVGDIVSLCLIAPLLMTALALRGGLLGWPWSLITISYACWLFYDATAYFGPVFHLDTQHVRVVSEAFRALGCLFQFSAGMSQRLVSRLMRA